MIDSVTGQPIRVTGSTGQLTIIVHHAQQPQVEELLRRSRIPHTTIPDAISDESGQSAMISLGSDVDGEHVQQLLDSVP